MGRETRRRGSGERQGKGGEGAALLATCTNSFSDELSLGCGSAGRVAKATRLCCGRITGCSCEAGGRSGGGVDDGEGDAEGHADDEEAAAGLV